MQPRVPRWTIHGQCGFQGLQILTIKQFVVPTRSASHWTVPRWQNFVDWHPEQQDVFRERQHAYHKRLRSYSLRSVDKLLDGRHSRGIHHRGADANQQRPVWQRV